MVIATRMVIISIVILLVLAVGGCWLQVYLSRRENRWLGLILPTVTLLWSLLRCLFVLVPADGSVAAPLLAAFLYGNIPTLVLVLIYVVCRERLKRRSDIDKMNIQDL